MGDQKLFILSAPDGIKPLVLHLQYLASTNPHWARVVGYGPFPLCVIHSEGCAPAVGTLICLMMMMKCIARRAVDRTVSTSCWTKLSYFSSYTLITSPYMTDLIGYIWQLKFTSYAKIYLYIQTYHSRFIPPPRHSSETLTFNQN
jgi:hypothetical protein